MTAMMHLTANFLIGVAELQGQAANDNRAGDEASMVRKLVSTTSTYTLAKFAREDGAP